MSNAPKPLPTLTEGEINRFWSGVEVRGDDECWPWLRSCFRGGYGQMKVSHRNIKAHRISFFLANGTDPIGYLVCHTCDNPRCCNPSN